MGEYDTALVCLNGHMINGQYNDSPQHNKKFCDKCGSPTIHQCPKCNANLQGDYIVRVYFGIGDSTPVPAYCFNCGQPFPWTETRLSAARELILESDLPDKEKLSENLTDLISDTPKTTLAASRWRKALEKIGKPSAEIFQKVLTEILTETAKKLLFP